MNPPNHTRFIVGCISVLSALCAMLGGWLLYKGFQSGELLVGTAGSGVSGLIGMLSMRAAAQTHPVEVSTPPNQPLSVTPTTPTPPPTDQ